MQTTKTRKAVSSYFYLEAVNHSSRIKTNPEDEGIPRGNLIHTMNVGYEVDNDKYFIRGSFRAKPRTYFEIPIAKEDMVQWCEQMMLMERVSFFDKPKKKEIYIDPDYITEENI